MEPTIEILAEVGIERDRQEAKGYDAEHDAKHGVDRLIGMAGERARPDETHSPEVKRARLVECAALVVAAIEVLDQS